MPRLIRDAAEVDNLRSRKQNVEQLLARDLYRVFNAGAAIVNLRTVVLRGLTSMHNGNRGAAAQALKDECSLDVLDGRYQATVPRNTLLSDEQAADRIATLTDHIEQLTASDCSDAIRLLGAYNERAQGDVLDLQASYRGGVLPWKPETAATGWAGQYWDESAAAWWGPGNRDRGRPPTGAQLPYERERAGVPDTADRVTRGPASISGMARKRAWRWSNVRKMDQLFGLLVGADISGTTADSTFIVESWGEGILAPAYYLLPAATIVYNMHHTLLEVALVLSIDKIIDYRIGFYDSLLPGEPAGVPPELTGILGALNRAETSADNNHFLLYYDEQREPPAGALLFGDGELGTLRALDLSSALRMHALLQNAPRFPTKKKVIELIQRTAPSIYTDLPLDFKT